LFIGGPITLIVWAAMRLGSEVGAGSLLLASARDIVEVVSNVFVPSFTAIELISLLPDYLLEFVNCGPVNVIVAIPAVDDVLTLTPD
jgi:hypothetical protein